MLALRTVTYCTENEETPELAERQADQVTQDVRKAHAEREDARNLASQAREQGARLSGQVDVLQAESKRRDAVEAAQHAENERLRVELEGVVSENGKNSTLRRATAFT